MLSLNNFILFAMATEIMYCTRDIPTIELSYEHNILSPNKIAENLSCPREKNVMFHWCNALFSRAHYRFYRKVFINQLGFESTGPKCQRETITFVSNSGRFPTDRSEFMFPCLGRHEPIRTNPQIDDYYYKFLLAATPDKKIFYVFIVQKREKNHVFKLYEEILDMTLPIPDVLLRQEDQSREKLLLTIPTINSWPNSVDRIYVNEVIIPNKPTEDQLQGVQSNELYMLCAFLLTTASYGNQEFIVDAERFQTWNRTPGFINLYFDHVDRSYNGAPQVAYPCYGKHYSGKTTDNQKHMNLFKISSGPRENSIIVYMHLSNQQDYKIKRIHENVNLKGLLATGPNYPQTEEGGPSDPASKRIKPETTVFPNISYPLPVVQNIALPHAPAPQPALSVWEQHHQFQRTDAPSSTAGQRPATSQLNPAHQIPSRDQQPQIQAAGLAYQTPTASQQLVPSHVGSSYHVLSSDQQFATQASGLPYHASTSGQQLTPPEVGSSHHVPSQHRQPVIQAVGPPILSPDKQLEAQVGGYSTAFQSADETNQQLSFGDYGPDFFSDLLDPQPSADQSGLLSDVFKQFDKDDSGPSEDP